MQLGRNVAFITRGLTPAGQVRFAQRMRVELNEDDLRAPGLQDALEKLPDYLHGAWRREAKHARLAEEIDRFVRGQPPGAPARTIVEIVDAIEQGLAA